ncbi:MAG TPA: cation diffusion facilitator family transporter [Dehalococcoidia bacterium]|nr:cation diffusion facilitator family transporter [Dehalococcoidia bacterium]
MKLLHGHDRGHDDHEHDHAHNAAHEADAHGHERGRGAGHGHDHSAPGGSLDLRTAEGIRAARWSSLALLITGAVELAIFAVGNSAGLLADAMHNLGDVATTLAIWAAFILSRREANERFPYGYHRAEDLAGVFVLIVMVASAIAAGYESLDHLITGSHPTHLWVSAAAALVGFAGNELTALYKTSVGKRIGSVSLEADGAHSRVDGLVSLAALAGIGGVAAGMERADGLAGVVITLVIAGVIVSTARGVIGRSMDSVNPTLTRQVHAVAGAVPDVLGVHDVRLRWAGRALFISLSIALPPELPLAQAHDAAEAVRHALLHEIDGVQGVDVHMDPGAEHDAAHTLTAHHGGG